ncbi:immunoglobulin-like domain-containing protein [Domibacillus robiginosus]|uniref:immunoglobulin-like domain-containing protein n=1 Tax=Domibacillus robiginosus TaxID=1071054 RepID=UPI00067D74BB|nr:immunoglobulin-like domain-containing protein [Domibacillus robiginosus]
MNNRAIFIFFLVILSFILAACQQEPENNKSKNQEDISSSEGITAQLEKKQYTTKDTKAVLTLHNNSKKTFLYGREYLLEKNVNSTWHEVPFKERVGFTDEAYYLAPNETESETISFDIFSEKLSAGHYRIIKNFSDDEKEYSPENIIPIAASFEVIE